MVRTIRDGKAGNGMPFGFEFRTGERRGGKQLLASQAAADSQIPGWTQLGQHDGSNSLSCGLKR